MFDKKNDENERPEPMIGKKLYYTTSEVCALTALEPRILRNWERDFTQLRPKKNRSGNRAYQDKDIELIRWIKYLLHEENYTVAGARKKITEERRELRLGKLRGGKEKYDRREKTPDSAQFVSPPPYELISEVRDELGNILAILEK